MAGSAVLRKGVRPPCGPHGRQRPLPPCGGEAAPSGGHGGGDPGGRRVNGLGAAAAKGGGRASPGSSPLSACGVCVVGGGCVRGSPHRDVRVWEAEGAAAAAAAVARPQRPSRLPLFSSALGGNRASRPLSAATPLRRAGLFRCRRGAGESAPGCSSPSPLFPPAGGGGGGSGGSGSLSAPGRLRRDAGETRARR